LPHQTGNPVPKPKAAQHGEKPRGLSKVKYKQWWASYFYKVTELIYFHYSYKKLATFNPLPIFPCNGSVTVTSY
jgi:hypothetical protein